MPKYTFTRRSIVEEIFTVTAGSEKEAYEMVEEGHPQVAFEYGEWLDWADNRYLLEDVEDELVKFIRSKP